MALIIAVAVGVVAVIAVEFSFVVVVVENYYRLGEIVCITALVVAGAIAVVAVYFYWNGYFCSSGYLFKLVLSNLLPRHTFPPQHGTEVAQHIFSPARLLSVLALSGFVAVLPQRRQISRYLELMHIAQLPAKLDKLPYKHCSVALLSICLCILLLFLFLFSLLLLPCCSF